MEKKQIVKKMKKIVKKHAKHDKDERGGPSSKGFAEYKARQDAWGERAMNWGEKDKEWKHPINKKLHD
jgi:hypothetical protein